MKRPTGYDDYDAKRSSVIHDGTVTSVTVKRSTWYDDYDAKRSSVIHDWRYQPYQVNGVPVPVCSPVEYILKLDK